MKSRFWMLIFGAVLVICIGLSLWLFQPTAPAAQAEIWSDGVLIRTVPLTVDDEFVVENGSGTNVVTVKDGKVAVTEADCPDGYCMARGWCSGGTQIVCLPNRLVLEFVGSTTVDGVTG